MVAPTIWVSIISWLLVRWLLVCLFAMTELYPNLGQLLWHTAGGKAAACISQQQPTESLLMPTLLQVLVNNSGQALGQPRNSSSWWVTLHTQFKNQQQPAAMTAADLECDCSLREAEVVGHWITSCVLLAQGPSNTELTCCCACKRCKSWQVRDGAAWTCCRCGSRGLQDSLAPWRLPASLVLRLARPACSSIRYGPSRHATKALCSFRGHILSGQLPNQPNTGQLLLLGIVRSGACGGGGVLQPCADTCYCAGAAWAGLSAVLPASAWLNTNCGLLCCGSL